MAIICLVVFLHPDYLLLQCGNGVCAGIYCLIGEITLLFMIDDPLLENDKLFSQPSFFLLLITMLPRSIDDALWADSNVTLNFLDEVVRFVRGFPAFRNSSKGLLPPVTEILPLHFS